MTALLVWSLYRIMRLVVLGFLWFLGFRSAGVMKGAWTVLAPLHAQSHAAPRLSRSPVSVANVWRIRSARKRVLRYAGEGCDRVGILGHQNAVYAVSGSRDVVCVLFGLLSCLLAPRLPVNI